MLAFHKDFRDTDEVVDLAMFAEASDKILLNTTNRTSAFNPFIYFQHWLELNGEVFKEHSYNLLIFP